MTDLVTITEADKLFELVKDLTDRHRQSDERIYQEEGLSLIHI